MWMTPATPLDSYLGMSESGLACVKRRPHFLRHKPFGRFMMLFWEVWGGNPAKFPRKLIDEISFIAESAANYSNLAILPSHLRGGMLPCPPKFFHGRHHSISMKCAHELQPGHPIASALFHRFFSLLMILDGRSIKPTPCLL